MSNIFFFFEFRMNLKFDKDHMKKKILVSFYLQALIWYICRYEKVSIRDLRRLFLFLSRKKIGVNGRPPKGKNDPQSKKWKHFYETFQRRWIV